jgi:hypothetical protein
MSSERCKQKKFSRGVDALDRLSFLSVGTSQSLMGGGL